MTQRSVALANKKPQIRFEGIVWIALLVTLTFLSFRSSGKLNRLESEVERNAQAAHSKMDELRTDLSKLQGETENGRTATSTEQIKYISEKLEKELFELAREIKVTNREILVNKKESEENLKLSLLRAKELVDAVSKISDIMKNDADRWKCQKMFVDNFKEN